MGTYQSKFTGAEIDAKLSQIGQGAAKKTVLFEGEFSTVGSFSETGLLSDSIYNYDLIYVTTYQKKDTASKKLRLITTVVDPELVNNNYAGTQTNVMWIANALPGTTETSGYYMEGNFGDGTQLSIGYMKTQSGSESRIHGVCKVVGVKY